MADQTREFAARLETLMPRLIRSLFNPDPEDPLVDLPLAQLRVIRTLWHGNRTVSELSEEFGLSMSACTQMVNRLESMGLVARREDEEDRRVRHVGLSEKGRLQMRARHERRVDRAASVLVGFTGEEQEQVVSLLQRMLVVAEQNARGKETLVSIAEELQAFPLAPSEGSPS